MSVLHKKVSRANDGFEQRGVAAFSTTDATVELPVDFAYIESIELTPLAAYAAADKLSCNETVGADGIIVRPLTGTITIERNTGGTSGLKFSFNIRGF